MLKEIKAKLKKHVLISKIIKNSSWIVSQNIFTMIVGVFITSIVARYLGTERFGMFNYVLSIVSLFAGVAAIGINQTAVKELKDFPEDEGKIIGTSFTLRMIMAIILIVICDLVILAINGEDKTIIVMGIILSSIMIFNCFEVIDYYAVSQMKTKYVSIPKMLSFIILSIMKIIVIVFDLGVIAYTIAYVFETILYATLLCFSYKIMHKETKNKVKWIFDKEYARKLLQKSWYYALSAIMVTIYMRIDQAMLGAMIEQKSEVGIYSAAVRIAEMWTFVPIAIITAMKPAIMEYKKTDNENYKKSMNKLYYIVSLTCIIFAIGITIFSRIIILILYGSEYLLAGTFLNVLIIAIWLGEIGNVHYVWLVCENKGKYSLFYSFTGCIVNIIANLLLIPKYGGLGASIATLISQFSANVLSFSLFKETRQLSINAIKSIFLIDLFKDVKKYLENKNNSIRNM